jgi:hypothetical protein
MDFQWLCVEHHKSTAACDQPYASISLAALFHRRD